jgi:hypothetical protein
MDTKLTLAIPRSNNNGNTRESLVDELIDCRDKIDAALKVLCACEFTNGRNFQTYPDNSQYQLAREQHRARIAALENVNKELLEIAINIQEAS